MTSADLKPYSSYRPSGVEWIGNVPVNWEVAALRHRYSQCLGKMLDSKRTTGSALLPYLRNTDVQWDRINIENLPTMDIFPEEYDRYTVQPGDLLVCEGGEVGRSALWSDRLTRCGFQKALHRLRPRNATQDVTRFMYYALRVAANRRAFTDGHLSTIEHLTGDKLRTHHFPFPPLSEQAAIVRFLDHADRRIRGYIRTKQNLIALLEEQKRAIIHQAVTGQIDVQTGEPYPTYKPSGVEWLPEVPEYWELRRLKQCARTISKGTTPSTEGRNVFGVGPVRFLKAENITSMGIVDHPSHFVDEQTNNLLRRSQLMVGDVLFVIAGALGKTSVVFEELLPANTNQAVAFIRPQKRVLSNYIAFFLQSPRAKDATWLNAVQSAQPNLSMADLGSFLLPLPSLSEQSTIVEFVELMTASLDTAIDNARRQIALLQELRNRVITDVVTGKIDVRRAAGELPEVNLVDVPDSRSSTAEVCAHADIDLSHNVAELV